MMTYTSAYKSFVAREQEIVYLYSEARKLERSDAIANSSGINALCRAAVVLLSARLEAYVKELGELTLQQIHAQQVVRSRLAERFFFYLSQDMLKEIRETDEPQALAGKLFALLARDQVNWSQLGPFPAPLPVHVFNKGFSSPALKKVMAYFNRFGYEVYKRDMQRHLKALYNPAANMVDQLVDLRNRIAHGDQSATLTPAEVKDMTRLIQAYCRATDVVFSRWCKVSLCGIK